MSRALPDPRPISPPFPAHAEQRLPRARHRVSARLGRGPAPAPARWANAEKSAIGTAIGDSSAVWFSMADGVLTEVFHPASDHACIRSLGFVVTGDAGFVSEETTQTVHQERTPRGPARVATTVNTCKQGRSRLEKQTLCAPDSSVGCRARRVAASYDGVARERGWNAAGAGVGSG